MITMATATLIFFGFTALWNVLMFIMWSDRGYLNKCYKFVYFVLAFASIVFLGYNLGFLIVV